MAISDSSVTHQVTHLGMTTKGCMAKGEAVERSVTPTSPTRER